MGTFEFACSLIGAVAGLITIIRFFRDSDN